MSRAIPNGKLPVHPPSVSNSDGVFEDSDSSGLGYGLTKREHFAGLAPDNVPRWFFQVFAESKNSKPEFTWSRESTEFTIGECGFTQDGEIAMYFAWRAYYADALLKELSK